MSIVSYWENAVNLTVMFCLHFSTYAYIIKTKGGIPMKYMFPEIKRNFGFGCMRMKLKGDDVDHEEFCRMIDIFLANGFN